MSAVRTVVIAEPWDVKQRLSELGLEESVLQYSVQRGYTAWASCTRNHPPAFGGISAWGESVCALREQLLPLGWVRLNEENLPLVVSEKGDIAISVSTADEDTGRKDGNPCTRSAKGPKTAGVVIANQELLFPEMAIPLDVKGRSTWLLLIHRDKAAREVRCELSKPISMTTEGKIDGWAERIIGCQQESATQVGFAGILKAVRSGDVRWLEARRKLG